MNDMVLVLFFWISLIGSIFYLGRVKRDNYINSTLKVCEKIRDIKGCTSDWTGVRTCSYVTESGKVISGNVDKSDKICWRVKK